jgi:hypothetical protein
MTQPDGCIQQKGGSSEPPFSSLAQSLDAFGGQRSYHTAAKVF